MLLSDRDRGGGGSTDVAPLLQSGLAQSSALSVERSVYAPSVSTQLVGLGSTAAIFAAMAAGFFVTISYAVSAPPQQQSTLTVVTLLPESSPPETPPEEKEAPRPVEKKQSPEPPRVEPAERTIVPIAHVSAPSPMPVVTLRAADPGPVEPETATPETAPAPPAPQVSSNAPDSWEGRVLAALNKYRRYPRAAMARRQQGVPYIRFVMDREGKVLSSRLERSSGYPDLDREAVALAKRASPLPRPPDDRPGDTLELVVPVQFFMK